MPFSLVAIDLDGTLLDSQHRLSAANHAAVRACVDAGVRVVLATGRMFASVLPYARALDLPGPHITLNGATIANADTGGLRSNHLLTDALLEPVVAALMEREIAFTVFSPERIYTLVGTSHLNILTGYGEPPAVEVPHISTATIPQPAKVAAFLEESPLDDELRALLGDRLEVVRTGGAFLEFLVPGVSKGAALAELMADWAIPAEQVLAIGDSYNDLSMFAVAGTSVAMAGAVPAVRSRATTFTASCNEDGVALALQRFVLQND